MFMPNFQPVVRPLREDMTIVLTPLDIESVLCVERTQGVRAAERECRRLISFYAAREHAIARGLYPRRD
jgi:hypothetical protein